MESKLAQLVKGKTVFVCIGNPLRGDDGVGPWLADKLEQESTAIVINTGEVPESYTGRIIAQAPQTVILIDAVNFGGQPGDLAILERSDLSSMGMFTHQLPLGLYMDYLSKETGATIFLIGIQPLATHFGTAISHEVQAGAEFLLQCLLQILTENERI